MKKKFLSAVLCLCMVVGMLPSMMSTAAAATNGHTRDDAVAKAIEMYRNPRDYDGVYGVQCVDMTWEYYRYLGYSISGNARDYVSNWVPPGWNRYSNGQTTPQAGDIVVFGAYQYQSDEWGHVGIVVDANASNYYYVDYNGGMPKDGRGYRTLGINSFSCVIRPDWPSPQPTATAQNLGNDFYANISYNGAYLQTSGIVTENGQNMDIQTNRRLNSTDSKQIWHFIRQSNGSYKIKNVFSNDWVLDVQGANAGDGIKVRMWFDDHGYACQQWYLMQSPGTSTYRIVSALRYPNELYSIDLHDAEGSKIQLWQQNSNAWQQFTITKVSYNPSCVVNVSASPSAGGTVTGTGQYSQGTKVTVTATPNTGFWFVYWIENDKVVSNSSNYTFTVNANRDLTAVFQAEQCEINTIASPLEGGSATGGRLYLFGDKVTVVATPNDGYVFKGWTENGSTVSTSANYTFTASGNQTLTAVFEKKQAPSYTINASASPAAGGTVSGSGTYQINTNATVTATPKEGYVFKGWTENGSTVSTSASYTFTVSADRDLTAVFEAKGAIAPTITTWPTASTISYGQQLSDSKLSGGKASVDGIFHWTDPSMGARLGQSYDVTFTPSETDKYSTVNGKVSVAVNKSVPKLSVSARQSGMSVMVDVAASNPYNTALTDVPTPTVTYRIGNGTAQKVAGKSFAIPADTKDGTTVTVIASTAGNEYYQASEKNTTLTVTNEAVYHVLTTSGSELGGAVNIQSSSAKQGETVTVTAEPRNGYTLGTVTATDANGAAVRLNDLGSGRYTFTMPGSDVTLDVVFEATQDDWINPFSDIVKGAWYYDAVRFVSQNGLMNGNNGVFDHSGDLSRAMIAQILYNKEGRPTVAGGQVFSDVASGTWYANAVAWAAENEIVFGTEKGLFSPNDPITREQLAVILWRYTGRPASSIVTLDFTDAGRISSYAREAMDWAVSNGIISGKGGGVLDPQGPATRAQVAQMLKNFLDK